MKKRFFFLINEFSSDSDFFLVISLLKTKHKCLNGRIRLFMSQKSGLQQSPLLAANDDEETSTIMPLTRYEYGKEKFRDVTETQKL